MANSATAIANTNLLATFISNTPTALSRRCGGVADGRTSASRTRLKRLFRRRLQRSRRGVLTIEICNELFRDVHRFGGAQDSLNLGDVQNQSDAARFRKPVQCFTDLLVHRSEHV